MSNSISLLRSKIIYALPTTWAAWGVGDVVISSLPLLSFHTSPSSSVDPSNRLQSFWIRFLQSGLSISFCFWQEVSDSVYSCSVDNCYIWPSPWVSGKYLVHHGMLYEWSGNVFLCMMYTLLLWPFLFFLLFVILLLHSALKCFCPFLKINFPRGAISLVNRLRLFL